MKRCDRCCARLPSSARPPWPRPTPTARPTTLGPTARPALPIAAWKGDVQMVAQATGVACAGLLPSPLGTPQRCAERCAGLASWRAPAPTLPPPLRHPSCSERSICSPCNPLRTPRGCCGALCHGRAHLATSPSEPPSTAAATRSATSRRLWTRWRTYGRISIRGWAQCSGSTSLRWFCMTGWRRRSLPRSSEMDGSSSTRWIWGGAR
mmetsp:Transcript_13753/g.44016  ORF Transcript_13753/g.44016 Transcript_13753/m.44016 type:complete len:208 (-) Transcript_13753:542-1165(-)